MINSTFVSIFTKIRRRTDFWTRLYSCPGAPVIENRYALLLAARPRQEHDGLNSLRYELVRRTRYRWATQVTVRVCHTLCLLCSSSSASSLSSPDATAVPMPDSAALPVPMPVPMHPAGVSLLAPATAPAPPSYAHSLAHRPSITADGDADGDQSLVFRAIGRGRGGGPELDGRS